MTSASLLVQLNTCRLLLTTIMWYRLDEGHKTEVFAFPLGSGVVRAISSSG